MVHSPSGEAVMTNGVFCTAKELEETVPELNGQNFTSSASRKDPHPVKVVNDVSRVTASKVGHRHADLLVVIIQVDAHVFLDLLPSE